MTSPASSGRGRGVRPADTRHVWTLECPTQVVTSPLVCCCLMSDVFQGFPGHVGVDTVFTSQTKVWARFLTKTRERNCRTLITSPPGTTPPPPPARLTPAHGTALMNSSGTNLDQLITQNAFFFNQFCHFILMRAISTVA